jgi:hypothetical protein
MKVSEVRKAVVAVLAVLVAVGNAFVSAVGDDALSSQDVVTVIVAALVAIGVYVVPNEKPVI